MRIVTSLVVGFTLVGVLGVVEVGYAAKTDPELVALFADLKNTLLALHPPPGNTRFTPLLASFGPSSPVVPGTFGCEVTNVTAAVHTISVQMIGAFTGLVSGQTTQVVSPGLSAQVTFGPVVGVFFCKFTVTDGSRNDIRAQITNYQPNTTNTELSATVLPAE